jgi:hypothetical protein
MHGNSGGCLCLGIFIGWLVRFCLDRIRTVTPKVMSAVASVACGGVVLAFLGDPLDIAKWVYPIGLVAYLAIHAVARRFGTHAD